MYRAMRFSAMCCVAFLGFVGMVSARSSNAQHLLEKKVNITFEQIELKEAFRQIEEEASVEFIYSSSVVNLEEKVSLRSQEEKLSGVLSKLLQGQNLTYSVTSNQIIIKRKASGPQENVGAGTIVGKVTSAESGEVLSYASIAIKGTSKGAVTDATGSFRMMGVKEGQYVLTVSFVGYEGQEKDVTVSSDEVAKINFELSPVFNELEGVTVTGMRKGETKALAKMKASENIKYVLSQEQMERFPDLTLSESLQRVPGVAVGYSYGLPRDIIIRGLSQDLSSVTVNGTRLPSTDAGGRSTNLNGVLSNSVQAIEVIKTLTPDMDADGTGGTVNIITKSPAQNEEILDAKASIGFNNLVDKMNYEAGFTYGKRYDKIGFVLGLNYLRTWRGEDRVEKGYDEFEIDENEQLMLEELDLTGYMIKRDNLGINAEFNFYPNEKSTYYLRGSINKFYEIQNRLRRIIRIGGYTSEDQVEDIRITQFGNWRDYTRDIIVFSTGGQTSLSMFNVDFDLTYSRGNYDQPIYYNASFVRSGLSGVLNMRDPIAPQINFAETDPYNPVEYTTKRYINRHDMSLDQDGQFTLNVARNYNIGSAAGVLKFGGRLRYKYNDRSRNYFLHDLKEGEFVLSDYLSDYEKDDHFNNNYVLNNFPEAESMESYYSANKELFSDNENYTRQNTDPDSFTGNEYLGAGYVMTKLSIQKLEVVAGVRYENTGFDYNGNQVNFDESGNYISTIEVNSEKTFDGFFPSVNLKYSVTPNTILRAAITKSLARPSYYDLVPWEEVLNNREEINLGNPELTQATSTNYDLLFEHYFQSVGLISGGVFLKNIDNYIYESNYIIEGGEFDGWEAEQVVNGATATAKGFELSWQQQLTFLPGFLNGLGVHANYSYVDSKFEVPGIETTRTVKLPEMRPHVGNVSLSYEKYGFSGRISMYFYDTYITELGETQARDELERSRKQIDISASQQISAKWSVFVGISNISNSSISFKFGDGRPLDDMYYSSWGNIGLRFNAY